MVCVGLWCMDEYWYYAIFTLVMLVIFESTVVKSRQRNLEELHHLKPPAMSLLVHRAGKWDRREAADLLPGDVVSIARPVGKVAGAPGYHHPRLVFVGFKITVTR